MVLVRILLSLLALAIAFVLVTRLADGNRAPQPGGFANVPHPVGESAVPARKAVRS